MTDYRQKWLNGTCIYKWFQWDLTCTWRQLCNASYFSKSLHDVKNLTTRLIDFHLSVNNHHSIINHCHSHTIICFWSVSLLNIFFHGEQRWWNIYIRSLAMWSEVQTDETVSGAGTIETEIYSLSVWVTRTVQSMEWTILSLSTVFFINAQFLFNAFGGLMIQCWRWLQWKKKKGWDFLYIYLGMRVVSYSEWMEYLCVGICWSRMALCGEIFECQSEIKTDLQNVGLEIPAEWAWFLCKPQAKVIKFLCVILPTVYVWGGLLYVGIFSLIFGENNHQMVKFLQKKYFQKHNAKKKIFRS